MATSSLKHLEYISHSHVVCLMFEITIVSANGSDDLSSCFDRDRRMGQEELTDNKNMKGKYHVRSMSSVLRSIGKITQVILYLS